MPERTVTLVAMGTSGHKRSSFVRFIGSNVELIVFVEPIPEEWRQGQEHTVSGILAKVSPA